uniref:Uncharacterized protein n=1 Tax=Triticum urartu TaxID=4572 RepID=A0A8R7U5X4_TRIUA
KKKKNSPTRVSFSAPPLAGARHHLHLRRPRGCLSVHRGGAGAGEADWTTEESLPAPPTRPAPIPIPPPTRRRVSRPPTPREASSCTVVYLEERSVVFYRDRGILS